MVGNDGHAAAADVPGRWAELVEPGRRGPVAVLAAGVLLFAVDTYVTASLLPSAVADIGGEAFYAWVTTIYLLAALVAAVLLSRLLAVATPTRAFLLALAAFGLGSLIDALSPSMAVLLVGRAVQGAGGGLMSAMSYALIRTAMPRRLWTRASAVISMMWGVGLLVGPALGGVFAELGVWRVAFAVLAVGAVAVALGVPSALRRTAGRPPTARGAFPVVSVLLVGGSAGALSLSGLGRDVRLAGVGLVAAAALLVSFVAHERRLVRTGRPAGVLPVAVLDRRSPSWAVFATIAVLVGDSAVEAFVPLFGQRLGNLPPLVAGFLGTCLAAGWVVGEIASAGVRRPRLAVVLGPVLLVAGLAVGALTQAADALGPRTVVWAAALAVGGAGIGVAWPHLAAAAMGAAEPDDAGEGDKASAAVSTVQMLAVAIGASLAGVAVGLGEPDPASSARLLYAALAAVAVAGVATAVRARWATPAP